MKKFNLYLGDTLREKVEKDMKSAGLMHIAEFIRMVLRQWPFREGKQWGDQDMKDFAKQYASRPAEEPYILEDEEHRLNRAFDKFKTTR